MRNLIARILNLDPMDSGQARRQAENNAIRLLYARNACIVYPHENADGKIQWTRI